MSDFDFFTSIMYSTYNGMVRGLYREHQHTLVNEKCLGSWVSNDLNNLEKVWNRVADMDFLNIPYEDAIEAAKDLVDLIYKNREYC